jgi:Bacterial Ig domain
MNNFKRTRVALAALAGATLLAAAPAHAVRFALKASAYLETMPDGTQVTMWGYRASVANPTTAQINALAATTTGFVSPGAALVVPPGDSTLEIVLINGLPSGHITSLVVHGLVNGSDPVFATAAGSTGVVCTPGTGTLTDQRACRLRSLTSETPNGTAAANRRTYTFSNVAPGTYLYQSGTHQQVQVQMGLYGMASKEAQSSGTQRFAYGSAGAQTAPFDNEVKLVFSEVDAALHAAVTAGSLSGSTIDYQPTHFRLHRYAAPTTANPVAATLLRHAAPNSSNQTIAVPSDRRQLLRMVNAGLTSRSPGLRDGHWKLVAEDGKPYPYPREEAGALMPAAKSLDAIISPIRSASATTATENDIVVFDRRVGLSTAADGRLNGDYIRLRVDNVSAIPIVDLGQLTTAGVQGLPYSGTVSATGGLAPYNFALTQFPAGMTIDALTGDIAWTPSNAQAQLPSNPTLTNTVTVRVTSANGRTSLATTYLDVVNVNDAPLATADTFGVVGGLVTSSAGLNLKSNDSDPDGNPLTVVAASGALPTGVTLGADGSLTYDVQNEAWYRALPATATQRVNFSYVVSDSLGAASLPGNVTLNVRGHQAPVARADTVSYTLTPARPAMDIPVLTNDTAEAGWTLVPSTLQRVGAAPNRGGTVSAVDAATGAACTVSTASCVMRYRPSPLLLRGTESFSYRVQDNFGRWSNNVVVRVNLL